MAPDRPFLTIVSGLPRSGTSLMMKMLEAGGLPVLVDNVREADVDNLVTERAKHAPQPVAGRPCAKFQRLIAGYDRRQRQLRALRGEFSHQGNGIDLAADRRVAGDDCAWRDFKRQSAPRDGPRRGSAVLAAQRVARRERCGT